MRFPLAPMSGLLRGMTIALFGLPIGFAVAAALTPVPGARAGLAGMAGLLALLYAAVWLWARPRAFVVGPDGIGAEFPLRSKHWSRDGVFTATLVDPATIKAELGTVARVGAGGLFGAFGLGWSSKGHHVGLYVSRHADGIVLVKKNGRPLLLVTPSEPERFVAAVQG